MTVANSIRNVETFQGFNPKTKTVRDRHKGGEYRERDM